MSVYVTLEEAKDQIRITTEIEDSAIQAMLDASEAIILDYLKADDPPTFTDRQTEILKAVVKLQCAELYRFRGDSPGWEGQPVSDGQLSPVITNLLRRMRDPALA